MGTLKPTLRNIKTGEPVVDSDVVERKNVPTNKDTKPTLRSIKTGEPVVDPAKVAQKNVPLNTDIMPKLAVPKAQPVQNDPLAMLSDHSLMNTLQKDEQIRQQAMAAKPKYQNKEWSLDIEEPKGMDTEYLMDPLAMLNDYAETSTPKRQAERQKYDQYNYLRGFDGKNYKDNFLGQFGASYTLGRLTQDQSLAYNELMNNPTEANKLYAENLDRAIQQFSEGNAGTLDQHATAPVLSQTFANYLPQLADQAKYSAAGGLAGAAAGSFIPGIGTGFGIKAGIAAGSGKYAYDTMRGAAYKELVDLGVDAETAKDAASDEAFISGLIELADTGVDLATLGGGALIDMLAKGAKSKLSKSTIMKLVKKLTGNRALNYVLNIGQEGLEEGTQEAVSIANQRRVQNGTDNGKLGLAKDAASVFRKALTGEENEETRQRIRSSAVGGAEIGAIMGGLHVAGSKAAMKALRPQEAVSTSRQEPSANAPMNPQKAEVFNPTPNNSEINNLRNDLASTGNDANNMAPFRNKNTQSNNNTPVFRNDGDPYDIMPKLTTETAVRPELRQEPPEMVREAPPKETIPDIMPKLTISDNIDDRTAYMDALAKDEFVPGKQEPRPARAKKELRQDLLNLFSVQAGQRKETGKLIDDAADEMLRSGTVAYSTRKKLFESLYEKGTVAHKAPDDLESVRNMLKGAHIYVNPSIKEDLGEAYNPLRNIALGSGIYLTSNQNDPGVDVWAQSIADDAGPWAVDTTAAPSDQLNRILELAEQGKTSIWTLEQERQELEDRYGPNATADYVENMERRIDNALSNFADKAELEVDLKLKKELALKKEKAHQREMQKRKAERKERSEEFKRIQRTLYKLQKKTGKNDQKMNDALNQLSAEDRKLAEYALVRVATDAQKLTEAKKEKQSKVSENYWDSIDKDPNYIANKQTIEDLASIGKDRIADFTPKEVANLFRVITTIQTHIDNIEVEIGKENARKLSQLYHSSRQEIEKSKGRKRATKISRGMNEEQLSPMNQIEKYGGWNENGDFYSVFGKGLEDGERKKKQFIVESEKMLDSFKKKHKDWIAEADGQGKKSKWYTLELPDLMEYGEGHRPIFGDTVKAEFTPMMRVELARAVRNDDNLRHMEGGITFPDRETYCKGHKKDAYAKGRIIRMAPETAKREFAYENLTAEEKTLYSLMDKYFDGYVKKKINETSQIIDGVDKTISQHYAKLYVDPRFRTTTATKTDESIPAIGSLQARRSSRLPIMAMSVLDSFKDTKEKMSTYYGLAIPVRNAERLLNWADPSSGKSMKEALESKWGTEATSYLQDVIKRLQNPKVDTPSVFEEGANKLLSNYISAVFGMNPGIVLKQVTSLPLAASNLGVDTFPSAKQIKNVDTKKIFKYSPELEYRSLGYATQELAELTKNPNWTQKNKVTRLLTGGAIQAADRATVRAIWPWAENYVAKHTKLKRGTEGFYEKTAEIFNDTVTQTQPMYDVMHRPQIMTRKGITRALTLFKTVPLAQQNMIRKAAGQMAAVEREHGKDSMKAKQARKKAAKTVASVLVAALAYESAELINQFVKNAAKYYRDDDDELTAKSLGRKIVARSSSDLAGMFVGGGEIADLITHFTSDNKWYTLEIPGATQINELIIQLAHIGDESFELLKDVKEMTANGGDVKQYIEENGNKMLGNVKEAAATLATYFGIPATNTEKYVLGILQHLQPEAAEGYKILFDKTAKEDLKGLSGVELQTRLDALMGIRARDVSKKSVQEIQRLYETYGSDVVPSDIPDRLGNQPLTTVQHQKYVNVYGETLDANMNRLFDSEVYQKMPDSLKAEAVQCLYEVAKQKSVQKINETEPSKWVRDAINARTGVKNYVLYYAATKDLSKKEHKTKWLVKSGLPQAARWEIYKKSLASKPELKQLQAGKDAGVSIKTLLEFVGESAGMTSQEDIVPVIDRLDITSQQKSALYLGKWKKTNLYKVPWFRQHKRTLRKIARNDPYDILPKLTK